MPLKKSSRKPSPRTRTTRAEGGPAGDVDAGASPAPAVDRCWWAGADPIYIDYHDREWGFPVSDDRRLFEKICLEGFPSGSELADDPRQAAGVSGLASLISSSSESPASRNATSSGWSPDAAIVRHRGKIESARNNAKRALELVDEFGSLAAYFWRFEPAASSRPKRLTREVLSGMPTSTESIALSKDLKRRGWTFVGPTTVYAFMQAMGLVNDHVHDCATRAPAQQARDAFKRPL
jgi:DNA-3-methyladenine glycosylase I